MPARACCCCGGSFLVLGPKGLVVTSYLSITEALPGSAASSSSSCAGEIFFVFPPCPVPVRFKYMLYEHQRYTSDL